MAVLTTDPTDDRIAVSRRQVAALVLVLAVGMTFLHYAGVLPGWLNRLPEAAVPPFAVWLDRFFNFVKDDLRLLTLTRFLTEQLEVLLDATGNLLYGLHRWPYLGPIPWSAIAAALGVIGYTLGGWRLAFLAGGTFVWAALVGQWDITMQTVSVLAVSVPLAIAIGLVVGILCWKYHWLDTAVRPVLAVLQTLPFFTYLLPAVIFFKVGPTAGAVATTIYAIPPMVLMTTLGLKKVPGDIVESGQMSGCTRGQMLRHVYLPAARTEILVGVNQVIMLSLAMVVLTAFIGMPGLGAKLLSMMGSFKIGRSFEIGVTIVLLAVTLDRLSKAWTVRLPRHHPRGTPFHLRYGATLLTLGAFVAFILIAQLVPVLSEVSRGQSLSVGNQIDDLIKGFLAIDAVQAVTGAIRYVLNVWVLIPFRDFLLGIPITAFVLAIIAFALAVAGPRQAIYAGVFFSLVALSGWWDRSIITLYSVFAAVGIAALIGIPAGILASRSEKASTRVLLACDTAQTFPSFVYLIPAIMLFGITATSVVASILIFATVPLVRYTIEGLRSVPPEMTEAADMAGATRWQRLRTVELPLALPTMAVGFNQAIMFAFFMVIVAAFIGTQDLGQELQRTLAGTDLGKNFVLGICVSILALAFDLPIMKWANDQKRRLGL